MAGLRQRHHQQQQHKQQHKQQQHKQQYGVFTTGETETELTKIPAESDFLLAVTHDDGDDDDECGIFTMKMKINVYLD